MNEQSGPTHHKFDIYNKPPRWILALIGFLNLWLIVSFFHPRGGVVLVLIVLFSYIFLWRYADKYYSGCMNWVRQYWFRAIIYSLLCLIVLSLVLIEPLLTTIFVVTLSYLWNKDGKFVGVITKPNPLQERFPLTTTFKLSLAVTVILFWLPTILTFGAPYTDGSREYGFPLNYHSYNGGYCLLWDSEDTELWKQCQPKLNVFNYALDMLFMLGIPLLLNIIVLTLRKYLKEQHIHQLSILISVIVAVLLITLSIWFTESWKSVP